MPEMWARAIQARLSCGARGRLLVYIWHLNTKGPEMYYPHPLIARQMRQFPILWLPWRRYLTATGSDAKAFEKRQYRKAERAYRLMARSYQSPSIVRAIWDAFK